MANILSKLDGYKTYIGAAGLFGLAIYQASTGQYQAAFQSAASAVTMAGLRHSVAKGS